MTKPFHQVLEEVHKEYKDKNVMRMDMTFCSGTRCPKAISCQRWTRNLEALVRANKDGFNDRPVSIAEFSDWDGSCTNNMYIPIEEDKNAKRRY